MTGFFGRGSSTSGHDQNAQDSNPSSYTSANSGGHGGGGGGGGGGGYGRQDNSSGGASMNRAGSNAGTASTNDTGSQFGSINDDQMERASISTFGGATSVASSTNNNNNTYGKSGNYSPSNNNNTGLHSGSGSGGGGGGGGGGAISLGGIANEMIGQGDRHGQQQHAQSGYSSGNTTHNNNQSSNNHQDNNNNNHSGNNRGNSNNNNNNAASHSGSNSGGGHVTQSTGFNNASAFETTAQSNFVGADPIAVAADFTSETANVIFLSSEAGQGASRQPVTRFRVHEVNLNVHSDALSEIADEEEGEEIILEEDAATLKLLFGLMYNRSSPTLTMSDWQVVLRMARAAQKYDCARAKEVAAAYFTEQEQLGALSPFMTYAFAVQYKLSALEEAAAERSVRYDIHRLPELVFSMMGFAAYQKLSAFHARRQTHYQDVLNNISMDPSQLQDQCYFSSGICVVSPWNKLKGKLAWPRQAGRDGSKRPPEPTDVLKRVVTEIGQIDCGTCSKALCEGALQAQLALSSMPSYNEEDEASF